MSLKPSSILDIISNPRILKVQILDLLKLYKQGV